MITWDFMSNISEKPMRPIKNPSVGWVGIRSKHCSDRLHNREWDCDNSDNRMWRSLFERQKKTFWLRNDANLKI
jgi:hypothetical protein